MKPNPTISQKRLRRPAGYAYYWLVSAEVWRRPHDVWVHPKEACLLLAEGIVDSTPFTGFPGASRV